MSMVEEKTVDFVFADDRGSLTQLCHEGYSQVNVLFSRKGVERGGHYHKQAIECFYVISGAVQLTAKRDGKVKIYTFQKGSFFQVNPFVIHSMYFPEDCTMVAMYDKCVELSAGAKDIYPG